MSSKRVKKHNKQEVATAPVANNVKKKKIKVEKNEENIPVIENNVNNGKNAQTKVLDDIVNNSNDKTKREEITWPAEDLKELVEKMELNIPEADNLAYGTRADKLEWNNIVFKNYSVDDCKKTWFLLQKRIRRYRLLREVLMDAKEWIVNPPSKKNKRHPDMPRRPLSSYFYFYIKKRPKVNSENPSLDSAEISKLIGQMYRNLTPEKKAKYEKMAATSKAEYDEKLKYFIEAHPEFNLKKTNEKVPPPPKPVKERIPKRPQTPFGSYYYSELKKDNIPDAEKNTFKEVCKEKWKHLSDKKKLFWINWAEDEVAKYEEAVKRYKSTHPEFQIQPIRSILTKDEMHLKDRLAGKPNKPPTSAYNLFARMTMQSSIIKAIPIKERLTYVSSQWKECSEEEKQHYRDILTNMSEQYKSEYASYLETLSDEKRKLELQNNVPKKRKAVEENKASPPKKKRKPSPRTPRTKKTPPIQKFKEPEQPPISAFKYFGKTYKGSDPVAQAWKALTSEEKQHYDKELAKKKQEYIIAFEKFLKSLSKEELEAFSNSRNQAIKEAQSEDEEDDEDDDEEEESSSGSESEEEQSDS